MINIWYVMVPLLIGMIFCAFMAVGTLFGFPICVKINDKLLGKK